MGYKVSYDHLNAMYNNIYAYSGEWIGNLESVLKKVKALSTGKSITGKGADNIKSYMETVHRSCIEMLGLIITAHINNCLLYKNDYQENIDTSLHAVINSDTLSYIKSNLISTYNSSWLVNNELQRALAQVSDIFLFTPGNLWDVENKYDAVNRHIKWMDENINALENRHYNNDFSEVEAMIRTLSAFIKEQLSQGRNYKTDFTPVLLAGSENFRNLYQSLQVLLESQDAKSVAVNKAIENENARITALMEEYEDRKRTADTINWIVTGLCLVGSIIAIVATAGAATPLIMGGISAVSGAIVSGTNSATEQYIQTGDWTKIDPSKVSLEMGKGAVTGFISGAMGAGISNGVKNLIGKTVAGKALEASNKLAVHIGYEAVVGSVSDVTSGIATRGTSKFVVTGGDVNEAFADAFNSNEILKDAISGGIGGGAEGAWNYYHPKSYKGELMSNKDPAYYDEYWRTNGIGSDETLKSFKEYYPDATMDDYFVLVKEKNPWPKGVTPQKIELKEGDTFYMVLDRGQGINQPGRWGTYADIKNVDQAREVLALPPGFKGDPNKLVAYTVKPGMTVTVEYGPIGPQIDLNVNKFYPGGADQLHIMIPRDADMMKYFDAKIVRRLH